MNYKISPIKNRDNNPVKFKGAIIYPQARSLDLPRLHFISTVVGSRGSGKTYSVCKVIQTYEQEGIYKDGLKHPLRTILFCPTLQGNPIYNSLSSLDEEDIHTEYTDQQLTEVLADMKAVKEESELYQEIVKAFNHFTKNGLKGLTNDQIMMLYNIDYDLENAVKPKYERTPVNILIFDDLVGTPGCFKATGNNSILSNFVIKNRHVQASAFFLVQALKNVPKIIRTNTSLYLLYKYNGNSIIKDMFEEVSSIVDEPTFETIYKTCTEEPYNFLVIDCTKKKTELKQNWDHLIEIESTKKVKKYRKKIKGGKAEILEVPEKDISPNKEK